MTALSQKSTPPKDLPPLSNEQFRKLPVGGSSRTAILNATGGTAEKIGKRNMDNTFALNVWGRRFVYVRNQNLNDSRSTAYNTQGLRESLVPKGAYTGKQLDHVASTRIEGGRMGNQYSLIAFVPTQANASHGRTNEKGPAPTREAGKAFQGGIGQKGKHHVSYMTNEMAGKLAGQNAQGRGHSVLQRDLTLAEREKMSKALLQTNSTQNRLKDLASKQQAPSKKQTGPVKTATRSVR